MDPLEALYQTAIPTIFSQIIEKKDLLSFSKYLREEFDNVIDALNFYAFMSSIHLSKPITDFFDLLTQDFSNVALVLTHDGKNDSIHDDLLAIAGFCAGIPELQKRAGQVFFLAIGYGIKPKLSPIGLQALQFLLPDYVNV
jgi:hypothetical protein